LQSLLKIFLAIFFGCASSWWLQQRFYLSSILCCALLGLAASLLPKKYFNQSLNYPSLIYLGSFIAMSSRALLPGMIDVLLASSLATGIFYWTKSLCVGWGGRLGSIAFIASLILWWGGKIW
jgi:hypothetical protein